MKPELKSVALAASLLAVSLQSGAESLRKPGISPSEAVRLIRSLEQAPLAPSAKQVRSELIDWAVSTQDVTIIVCEVLGPIPDMRVPYDSELAVQAMLGNGAFQLENPEHKGNVVKAQLAGIQSMLRAYERILSLDPTARIPEYDKWLQDMKAGRLEVHLAADVREKCLNVGEA